MPGIVEREQNSFPLARQTVLNSKLFFETFDVSNFEFSIIFQSSSQLLSLGVRNSKISASVTRTAAAHPAPPGGCSQEGCCLAACAGPGGHPAFAATIIVILTASSGLWPAVELIHNMD